MTDKIRRAQLQALAALTSAAALPAEQQQQLVRELGLTMHQPASEIIWAVIVRLRLATACMQAAVALTFELASQS